MQLTIFKNIFDNKTHKTMLFEDFQGLEDLLYSLHKKRTRKTPKGEKPSKGDAPLISPASYEEGTTRANRNVMEWCSWAALDVDDYECSYDELIAGIQDNYYVCYSTASSTKEHPKFRLVFPLTEPVHRDDISHFWFALNQEYLGEGDESTKDLSRMYYIPGQYPDAYNFIFTNKGPILDPKELMSRHEYTPTASNFFDNLPPQLKEEILNQRKATLTKTFQWTDYRDCPFVREELVMEYAALNDGRYRFLFQLMCSIAGIAVKKGYPITAEELETLVRQIDQRYQKNRFKTRPIIKEANRALEFVYGNM